MISYNWGSQPTVLAIRDRLKSAGINYWIDVENMCTYLHFTRVSSENILQQILVTLNIVFHMNSIIDVNLKYCTECCFWLAIIYGFVRVSV